MNASITPFSVSGNVVAPPSKSFAHRLMILALLSNEKCVIKNVGSSLDVKATFNAIKSLGGDASLTNGDFYFNSFKPVEKAVVDVGESGSTFRFMLSAVSVLGINAEFMGSERLFSRPKSELIKTLNLHGAGIKERTVNGKISFGEYEIDGSVSSQFVSSILIALSFFNEESKITVKGKAVSKGYVDLTVEALKLFNKEVIRDKNVFIIKKSKLLLKTETKVCGDYSSAAPFLVMGALGKGVFVSGLNQGSLQPDKKIISVLKEFGAEVSVLKDSVFTAKKELKGINFDVDEAPDIAMLVGVAGSFAKGTTVLKNVNRLKDKESDRLKALKDILKVAKVKYEEKENELYVFGGEVYGGVFDCALDHRTAMAVTVLTTFAKGDSVLYGIESVNKSYPDFFEDYKKIGGKINVDI